MSTTTPSLREICIFIAVYEERSFTAAARREQTTQSGVSHHIRHIEERLRVAVFERHGKTISPTAAGDAYYRRCLQVLHYHGLIDKPLAAFAKGLSGQARVGLIPALTHRLLAPACLEFHQAHPNASLRVVEAYSSKLLDSVLAGDLDLAIVPVSDRLPTGLEGHHFGHTFEYLVSARQSTLDHGRPIHLRDVPELKLIVPSDIHPYRATLEAYLSAQAIAAQRLEVDAMLGIFDLVQRSDWRVILPGVMLIDEFLASEPRQFTVNPLIDPALPFDLQMVQLAGRPLCAPAHAFLALLQANAQRQLRRLPSPHNALEPH